MEHFIKRFRRDGLGVWTCVSPAEFNLPMGRVQVAVMTRFTRGTTFMGVDVAQVLDDEYERQRAAPSALPVT